jgi:glucan phosphoethanolaminetransferase (alkaline phosphatase superfamily)
METVSAIALGIGLSASAGFRAFIPLLIAGIASHFGVLPLGESFEWMGSTLALICFGAAAVLEVLAYYIPFIDNLIDTIATPLSIVAGTLLMTSVFPAENEWMKWILGFIVGGGAAATIQSGSTITRLFSSKFTAGAGNPVVSTTEGVAATGFSILSLIIPIIVAILIVILIVFILRILYKKLIKRKKQYVQ